MHLTSKHSFEMNKIPAAQSWAQPDNVTTLVLDGKHPVAFEQSCLVCTSLAADNTLKAYSLNSEACVSSQKAPQDGGCRNEPGKPGQTLWVVVGEGVCEGPFLGPSESLPALSPPFHFISSIPFISLLRIDHLKGKKGHT